MKTCRIVVCAVEMLCSLCFSGRERGDSFCSRLLAAVGVTGTVQQHINVAPRPPPQNHPSLLRLVLGVRPQIKDGLGLVLGPRRGELIIVDVGRSILEERLARLLVCPKRGVSSARWAAKRSGKGLTSISRELSSIIPCTICCVAEAPTLPPLPGPTTGGMGFIVFWGS